MVIIVKGRSKNTEKKYCTECEKTKKITEFYNSNNPMFDGKSPICKPCMWGMVNYEDIETVYRALKLLDIPFIYEHWKSATESGANVFGSYVRMINTLRQFRGLTWKDSVFKSSIKPIESVDPNDANITTQPSDFIASQDIINFWGSGYSHEEYKKLTTFYEDMKNSYEIETASHKDYLKKICIVSLKMEQALAEDQINQFKYLSDVYDKLMKSAKFTAVQRSAADRTGGMNTFSEFFEFIEKEGFIPKYHIDEPKDIVDKTIENLMKYTKNLILGDPNIGGLVETALMKMQEKEEQGNEELYEDGNYDEEYFVEDVDGEFLNEGELK